MSGLFLLQKSSKYRLPFAIFRPHEISEKKFYEIHVTAAVFSPRRVSEEVKRHSSRTLKTEYATLRFISVICGATSFLPP